MNLRILPRHAPLPGPATCLGKTAWRRDRDGSSLPTGCHGPAESMLAPSASASARRPATRTSTASTTVDRVTSLSRWHDRSSASSRTCVAHAGSSTSTSSRPPLEAHRADVGGDGVADGLVPPPEHAADACAAPARPASRPAASAATPSSAAVNGHRVRLVHRAHVAPPHRWPNGQSGDDGAGLDAEDPLGRRQPRGARRRS